MVRSHDGVSEVLNKDAILEERVFNYLNSLVLDLPYFLKYTDPFVFVDFSQVLTHNDLVCVKREHVETVGQFFAPTHDESLYKHHCVLMEPTLTIN